MRFGSSVINSALPVGHVQTPLKTMIWPPRGHQLPAKDFFDSIGLSRPSPASTRYGSYRADKRPSAPRERNWPKPATSAGRPNGRLAGEKPPFCGSAGLPGRSPNASRPRESPYSFIGPSSPQTYSGAVRVLSRMTPGVISC